MPLASAASFICLAMKLFCPTKTKRFKAIVSLRKSNQAFAAAFECSKLGTKPTQRLACFARPRQPARRHGRVQVFRLAGAKIRRSPQRSNPLKKLNYIVANCYGRIEGEVLVRRPDLPRLRTLF